jgi:acyl-CoA synthetase (AMP-forming)/AMP-acid ligase II
MVDALERHRITSFSGVPELYHALLSCTDLGRRSLPQLGYMTVAGGALDHDAALRVSALITPAKFYIMYGQTEATARLAYLPPEQLPHKPNSIGRAIPGVELQVQDDEGRQVSHGTAGELCCRGPNTMLGYWRDRRATAQAMRRGWLRTGDLATADGDGFFYLAGRKNEQLKIKGLKVVPRQVESAIAARMPKCQVVVIPYTVHSTTRLAMFVAPLKGPPPTPSEVHEICRATLARHEVPNRIRIIDRVPLTPSLKVDLASLSLQLENGQPRLPNVALTCPSVVSSANVEQAT